MGSVRQSYIHSKDNDKSRKMRLLSFSIFQYVLVPMALAQGQTKNYDLVRQGNDLMWCVITPEELAKCQALADAVNKAQTESEQFSDHTKGFGSHYRKILSKHYPSKDDCMKLIDEGHSKNPNIMTVDAGEVFSGGRYHSLVPIIKEMYDNDKDGLHQDYYYSLAVVKKDTLSYVTEMRHLQGVKACFPRVGSLAGWTIPIHKLIENKVMNISDCNNHVKSAIGFFGTSCAVNCLQDRYNPLGENPLQFCELCGSGTPGIRCTNRDPYAEYAGALICLKEKGDIAFLNEKILLNAVENPDDFELLCPQTDVYGGTGLSRMPVSSYKECAWGVAPGNALVVSSAMDMEERFAIQTLMEKIIDKFGSLPPPPPPLISSQNIEYEDNLISDDAIEDDRKFLLFESAPRYGLLRNLLFDDSTRRFGTLKPDDMSYKSFLNRVYGDSTLTPFEAINGVRKCPVGLMNLCVTSEPEMKKCVRMRTALNAQLLEPKMGCKR